MMSSRTDATPAPRNASDRPPTDPPAEGADRSVRDASLVAGVALLLMAALAGFGYMVAVESLVTPGDAVRTATDIAASAGLFRLGIVSLVLVVALDVVVAWALYRVLRPVSRGLSLLAAWFRLVYAGVFLVAISRLLEPLRLVTDDATAVLGLERASAHALMGIGAFNDVWDLGLVLFGTHLIVVGYLVCRSRFMPTLLGALVVVAGLGYVVDSLGAVLSGGAGPELATVTFVGEVLLALWLVTRGRRLSASEAAPQEDATGPVR